MPGPTGRERILRGQSVKVQRSLRSRVFAASAVAFLGLSAVVCIVLPRAYEAQAMAAFQDRVSAAARGLGALVAQQEAVDGSSFDRLSGWLASDPAFIAAAVMDARGALIDRWPETAGAFAAPTTSQARVVTDRSGTVASQPMRAGDPSSPWVMIRYSNAALIRDFENVRWLFATLFLFTSVVFFILSNYLTRTILHPLEEIGRAAMSLADGEPVVQVPQTGDREIDELGLFIAKLGESRRQSRVMTNPMELLVARHRQRAPKPAREAAPAEPDASSGSPAPEPDAKTDPRNPL